MSFRSKRSKRSRSFDHIRRIGKRVSTTLNRPKQSMPPRMWGLDILRRFLWDLFWSRRYDVRYWESRLVAQIRRNCFAHGVNTHKHTNCAELSAASYGLDSDIRGAQDV